MKYHHLTATVNGMIVDVLVDVDTYKSEGEEPKNYFVGSPDDAELKQTVEIIGSDYLPEVIG